MSLKKRLQAARQRWIEAQHEDIPGLELCIQRPTEAELHGFLGMSAEAIARHCAQNCVVDWRGITEADLLPAVGADEAVAFDVELYRDWVSDHVAVMRRVSNEVAADIDAFLQRREAAAGK
ncbi:MAG TPA: hypothetical protein PK177_14305 [Burkholderiaceae bacterium]|nr:hypothetical protein [Burkholderiaceae bacterium]